MIISVSKAVSLHDALIDDFGGSKGVRDLKGLESALARPYATFDLHNLYPSPFEKAAAIFESLIINHPFIDGNKRIAYTLMQITLQIYGFYISIPEDEQYNFVIAASTGKARFDEIKSWLENKALSI